MGSPFVWIDLPKDCSLMAADDFFTPWPAAIARNLLFKRQLRPRQHANCNVHVLRCREPSRAFAKVAGGKLIANLCRSRFDVVKTVITHLALLHCPAKA